MKTATRNRETGAIIIMFAIFLTLLLAFAALGMEMGRWFLVRAELSKTVDAAALIAAKNISNPNVDPLVLAREFCAENFPSGYVGTPMSGGGTPVFDVRKIGNDKIEVLGRVSATAIFARIVGFDLIPVSSLGVAQKRRVEIMLVLDRSGSMGGAMPDLKTAARTFVDFFEDTQAEDKLGLITFASSVRVDRALGTNYVAAMNAAINGMNAGGWTNAEDGIDQSDGGSGFTDQTGVNPQDRIQQFLIFFSDGNPTAFRDNFLYQNTNYDGVISVDGNCNPGDQVHDYLFHPANEGQHVRVTGGGSDVSAVPTGDGIGQCAWGGGGQQPSTRWYIFNTYPVPGYAPTACSIPQNQLAPHVCNTANALALANATVIKNKGIKVYAIGLGTIRDQFLQDISTGSGYVYKTPDSSELESLFQKVAQEIKLRLVQ